MPIGFGWGWWPPMRRTALLYLVPAALVVSGWLAVEKPVQGGRAFVLAGLALVPALVQPLRLRALAVLGVSVPAAWIALGVPIFQRHDFFGPLGSRFGKGFMEYYDFALPFDPHVHPRMHQALLAGIFLFCLAIGLAIAARRPLAAGLAVVVGAGWPATLLPGGSALVRGALVLGAVLLLLAGLRERPARRPLAALVLGTAVVGCALAASTSPAVAKSAFLSWQGWDLSANTGRSVGVSYVWDADYSGLDWPKKKTDVLEIQAGPRPTYWRATALGAFRYGRWLEDLTQAFSLRQNGRDVLVGDDLIPPRARQAVRWTKQVVTVEALRDMHLVGASMPAAYDACGLENVSYARGGVALVENGLDRGQSYSVWSYSARPTPAELARAGTRYPGSISRDGQDLEIGTGETVPLFGDRGRDRVVEALIGGSRVPKPYARLFRQARAVAGRATSPYAAVVAIESWLRDSGRFVYDEHPPATPGVPPLVAFVTETRRGYCQHFAGGMALMLRYLGIPARVAVGFTSGTYDKGSHTWTVTDHDAHAWVEAWFPGFGWLPFDPTPGRGTLSAPYTASSQAFDASGAAAVAGGLGPAVRKLLESKARGQSPGGRFRTENPFGRPAPPLPAVSHPIGPRGASLLELLAIVLGAILAAILGLKLVRARLRYLTRDPRRLASASRRELIEFLVDQQVEIAPSVTFTELAVVLNERYGIDAEGFSSVAGRARFGSPPAAEDAGARFREELRGLRRLLRRRVRTSERLLGAISLRSLRAT